MNITKPHNLVGADERRETQQERGYRIPPRANLLAAANYIRTFFDAKKFAWSFFGGLEILCLGYRREQPDLHVVYDSRDFERIRKKLESDHRVQLPSTINPLLRSKIIVHTGPHYKDSNCTETTTIVVDLIPSGSHGTPQSGSLESNTILLSLKTTDGKLKTYKGLNMLYLLRTTLQLCRSRDLAWDPRKDLLFLCQNYREDVQSSRSQLDQKEIQELFLGTAFFSRLSPEEQRNCYQVLLDREPPPVMIFTPPAPQPSVTATSGHQTHTKEHNEPRETRSRYRPISGPNGRTASPNDSNKALRTKSADSVLPSQPYGGATVPSTIRIVQDETIKDPRVVSMQNLNVAQARRSMPNLATGVPQLALLNTSPHMNAVASDHHRRYSNIPVANGAVQQDYFSPREKSRPEYGVNFRPSYMDPRGGVHPSEMDANSPELQSLHPGPQARTPEVLRSPTEGIQSQKGSLRETNQQGVESPSKRSAQEVFDSHTLHTALKATQQVQHLSAQHRKHSSVPIIRAPQNNRLVFELDATPQFQPQPKPSTFIAELPTNPTPSPNRNPPPSTQPNNTSPGTPPADTPSDVSPSIYSDSPSLPPWHDFVPAPLAPRPRLVTVASEGLPASLMAGRGAPSHQRAHSSSAFTQPAQRPALRTNVSRYSRYYAKAGTASSPLASPVTGLRSPNASPERAVEPVYKAYRPSSVALSSPQAQPKTRDNEASAHKRNASNESTTSQNSADLATEYQAELPKFERGYGK